MATSSVLAPIAEVAPLEMMRTTLSACSTPQLLDCRTDPLEDDYKMTSRVLGSGMNGDVRLAAHRETGESVAVKTFNLRGMSESAEDDMCREMTVQAALDHPNVVRARDIFVSAEHVHIVTEALEGGTLLDHVMKVRKLGEHRARLAVEQVLKAVEYMHDLGYVHRDIKLQNLVYAAADRHTVKLIDFGLCRKWTEGERPMKRRCGTVQYLAPEVMQSCYTNKADMWSVGVVAHALLTGDLPGRHEDWTPIMSARLAECSPEAQKFVAALLTVDPADRLTAQQALTHCFMLRQERRPARCDSFCSTAAGAEIEGFSSDSESDLDCTSPKPFSCLYPSEPSAPKLEKKSIWQALPTFGFGASRKVGAVLAAVRNCRSKRASRVSFEADL